MIWLELGFNGLVDFEFVTRLKNRQKSVRKFLNLKIQFQTFQID